MKPCLEKKRRRRRRTLKAKYINENTSNLKGPPQIWKKTAEYRTYRRKYLQAKYLSWINNSKYIRDMI